MRSGPKLAIATGAAALLAAALALRPWDWRAGPGEAGGAAPGGEQAHGGGPPPALALQPGSARAYALSFSTTVSSPGLPPRETTLDGRLAVRVVAGEDGAPGLALAAALESPRVVVDGARQPAMEARWAVPFVVAIAPDGRLGASRFPPSLAQGDRAVLDGTLRAFQVVLPAAPGGGWDATEEDQIGTFVAAYRRAGAGVEKAKLRYAAVHPPALFSAQVVSSALRAELDPDGPWLSRAEGAEELRLAPAAGGPATTVRARFRLEQEGSPAPGDAIWRDEALAAARARVDAGPPAPSAWDEAERRAARRRFQAAGVALDGLVARAGTARLPAPGLVQELAAYLRAFPEAAARVPRAVAAAGDGAAALLLHALELAGTPEAQDALLDVAEGGGQARRNRIRALVALNGVEAPTADTLERLERDARGAGGERSGVASTALLALGALAPRAPGAEGERIVGDLTRALEGADPQREHLLLLALENAEAPLPAGALERGLASPHAGVRQVAARLGGIAAEGDPTGLLLAALAREGDAQVRAELVAALLARPADPRANLAIAAALTGGGEPAAMVRVRMVAYLARQLPHFPANRELLRAYLPREPDRDVTLALLNALAR
jgi:hypothetical protein